MSLVTCLLSCVSYEQTDEVTAKLSVGALCRTAVTLSGAATTVTVAVGGFGSCPIALRRFGPATEAFCRRSTTVGHFVSLSLVLPCKEEKK